MNNRKAFTLVELAIVIVIIGLLVGGVLAGQELIRQAQIRTMLKDIESYKAAIVMYQGKYNAIPGDDLKAYNYFGDKCADNANHCNGNGNGLLLQSDATSGNFRDYENIRFWQHLNLAGFTKIPVYPEKNLFMGALGDSCPRMPFKSSGINVFHQTDSDAGWMLPTSFRGKHYFLIGGMYGTTSSNNTRHTRSGMITPAEAYSVDIKIDDGIPNTGMAGTYDDIPWTNEHLPGCKTGTGQNSAYDTSNSNIACHLIVAW